MAKFMLFLYDDPTQWLKFSPQEQQKAIEKYVAWGNKARQQKILVSSSKLADEPGKVMRPGKGKPRVTDGPYSETKEVLGGYYLIEAANYDQAIERIRDHPHLEHGTIEVREVDPRSGGG